MNGVPNGGGRERRPVIAAAARTDTGLRRAVNEDLALAQLPVFVVADGMGGHSAGDLASAAAIGAFARLAALGEGRPLVIADVDAALEAARCAVDEISREAERGAGCTLTGVVLVEHAGEPHWYVINVGDSRVYQHRGASLAQITSDHSLHAELTAAGHADAASTPRNVITRALGSDDARHDAWLLPLRTGMRLLVCSDGLTSELGDEELRAVLTVGGRADAVADELVRRACEAGGRDNVTVVVVDTVSDGLGPETPHEPLPDPGDADEVDETTLEVTRPVTR
ncbi:serine/threonine protein phosphatase [Leucobacter sp. UCD-THU]|uniref:PP2C family protein-serine/threonine phosphatase n=1 Tax=Leucobacter sp. UCD-THU TaxID=1292023 RepID=UPI00036D61B2|nr:protein phosphatase 2C domain-containing protein [Leucobacter sp. UCD-THU]EYT54409.1 serine/threonine protein phosphatase [Leucobacter sp. UCD-THU]